MIDAEDTLRKAGAGARFDRATWESVIHELLDRFAKTFSLDFVRDAEATINSDGSAFRIWFWSKPGGTGVLSAEWSAVFFGGPSGDVSFGAGVDLFIFDAGSGHRLYRSDGKHYVAFSFEDRPGEGWQSQGWVVDEFEEYAGLDNIHDAQPPTTTQP
jgi:hypothetical protein